MSRGRYRRSGAAIAALSLAACVSPSVRPDGPPRMVALRGTVFDSIALIPLRGARVTLTGTDTVTATTDTNGVFVVSLMSGTWRAAIAHARYDSLRVTLAARTLVVPPRASVIAELWTPSRHALTRMLCGDTANGDDVALVGMVRDAATRRGIDSASVVVKWINLQLKLGGFTRSAETHVARTARDGWYVSCGVPANGTLLTWAEHAGATSGAVPLTLEGAPMRVDVSLDASARRTGGSIDLEPDSAGVSMFPTASGKARYRVLVRDPSGSPLQNARVRILGQRTARTNAAGVVTLDSIAGGTQTLEVVALGYQSQRRIVDIVPGRQPADTFVLASVRTLLDTVRVTAGRDGTGFERRRSAGVGQFITAADIERESPQRTTALFKTRDGLRLTYDRHGFPYVEVTTQELPCKPLILVDGFPAPPVPTVPGEAAMDWLVHPDEIGGVEIYTNSGKTPPEIARWGRTCATIAFWTRQALGLPKTP
ncbi:MAG: carboxypeptidase-like regulatory domain-containing protein [Gemmatimonadaceae bacterium]